MKYLMLARLHFLLMVLALQQWRVRRMARAIERANNLPTGWLLIPGNAQRFAEWERGRMRWQTIQEAWRS